MWDTDARAGPEPRLVRILDVDPDLAVDLDPERSRDATAELRAPVARVEWERNDGRWGPSDPEGHLGLLIVQGALLREVGLLGTSSAEVLGEGDVVRPWDVDGAYTLPVPTDLHWSVLVPCEVAILGPPFLRRAGRWPEVLARLAGRCVSRAQSLALHDAITNLKHVETRLLVQFWHLADRFGRVGPTGISIRLPLTHEMLGKLVGATRPSVTTALGRLAARGLLVRENGGMWRLSADSGEALAPMPVEADTQLVS
jgi:CRP/FNR family transcriptional regulator, cyclic AMP receptor protein